jgi:hypothetical protein
MFSITLKTNRPLSKSEVKIWQDTVTQLGPEGIVKPVPLRTKRLGTSKFQHLIELNRDIEPCEAEFIVSQWETEFSEDFSIETSLDVDQATSDCDTEYDISNDAMKTIQESATKALHNQWVHQKMNEGWRYGMNMDLNEHTHPALRDWDNLPISYRKPIVLTEKQIVLFYAKNRSLFT